MFQYPRHRAARLTHGGCHHCSSGGRCRHCWIKLSSDNKQFFITNFAHKSIIIHASTYIFIRIPVHFYLKRESFVSRLRMRSY